MAIAFDVTGGAPRQPSQVAHDPLLVAGPGGPPQYGISRSIGGHVAGAAAKVSGWYHAYQQFVAAAAKVNQLISFCCGVWLVMSTPLMLVGAALTFKFTEAFMILFLGMYGLLMLSVEIPLGGVQAMLRQYFFFVYTRPGRAAFVVYVAIVAWAVGSVGAGPSARSDTAGRELGAIPRLPSAYQLANPSQVGIVTKVLVAFNALLTFYILNSQDRRFAQADAEAKAVLQQASDEMRGQVGDALSFTKLVTDAFGGGSKFVGRRGSGPPSNGSGSLAGRDSAFDKLSEEPEGSVRAAWPSVSDGGNGDA